MKKFFASALVFTLVLLVGQSVLAADAVPGASFVDMLISALKSPVAITIGAFLMETLFRLTKTDKAAGIIHIVASVAMLIAKALVALAEFTDKILPQATTQAVTQEQPKA